MNLDELLVVQNLLAAHRPHDALARAAASLADNPAQPTMAALHAFALVGIGRPQDALEAAATSLASFPNEALLHRAQAAAASELGQLRAAVESIDQAVRLDPQEHTHHVQRAWYLAEFADAMPGSSPMRDDVIMRAGSAADTARVLAPADPASHFARTRVYLSQKYWGAAAESARRGLALDAADPLGHRLLGLAQAHDGNLRAAGDSFVDAARLDPRSSESNRMLGALHRMPLAMIFAFWLLVLPPILWFDGQGEWWSLMLPFGLGVALVVARFVRRRRSLSPRARAHLRRVKELA